MRINDHVFMAKKQLTEEVHVNTFLVEGLDYAVLIDSGIQQMFSEISRVVEEAGGASKLRYLINTHAHADHIGANQQLQDAYSLDIAAPAGARGWIENFDLHYREFCLIYPDIFPDSEWLRNEIYPLMDGETKVDLEIVEGTRFRLGGGVTLEAYAYPGHVAHEVGFFEPKTKTLILGDAITGYNWSFIHGHVTPRGFMYTLAKLEGLVEQLDVQIALTGHFAPTDGAGVLTHIRGARNYLVALDKLIESIVQDSNPKSLKEIWLEVITRWNKAREFRSLTSVHAHLTEGIEDGRYLVEDGLYRLS